MTITRARIELQKCREALDAGNLSAGASFDIQNKIDRLNRKLERW